MIRDSAGLPQGPGPRGDLRRRALLRRLQGRPRLRAADAPGGGARAGRRSLVLCDTNGGSLPWEIEAIVGAVREALARGAAGHPHATTTASWRSPTRWPPCAPGAIQVQGTINGYGERCGNANLCSIIAQPGAEDGLPVPAGRQPGQPDATCRTSWPRSPTWRPTAPGAYVGTSAFAHKGGIHVAAIRRNVDSYQHIDPTLVGNEMRVLVSRALRARQPAQQGRGVWAGPVDRSERGTCSSEIKELESQGLLVRGRRGLGRDADAPRTQPDYRAALRADRLHGRRRAPRGARPVRRGDGQGARRAARSMHTAAEGNGPVNALDTALRKALVPVYPQLGDVPPGRLQGAHPGRRRTAPARPRAC